MSAGEVVATICIDELEAARRDPRVRVFLDEADRYLTESEASALRWRLRQKILDGPLKLDDGRGRIDEMTNSSPIFPRKHQGNELA